MEKSFRGFDCFSMNHSMSSVITYADSEYRYETLHVIFLKMYSLYNYFQQNHYKQSLSFIRTNNKLL